MRDAGKTVRRELLGRDLDDVALGRLGVVSRATGFPTVAVQSLSSGHGLTRFASGALLTN